jgi:Uma2 family endonuclease
MSVAPAHSDVAVFGVPSFPVRRFSVAEYERMAEIGLLTEDDSVELLEGWIVPKITKYPRHDTTIDILTQLLGRLLPPGWFLRVQNVLVTSDSEPDVVVTRGEPKEYWKTHPRGSDVALVIEVSESSLRRDRRKRRIYARAGVPIYWIVNLDANRIEIYSVPDSATGEYQRSEVVPLAAPISFLLDDSASITLPLDTAFSFT